jgi:transposase-like protein
METKPAQAEVVEDGTQRDRRGRVKVKAERREELVAEYRHSGLSQAEFARRACVNYQTFAHWVQRARREAAEAAPLATPAMPRFAELRLPGAVRPSPRTAAGELSVSLPDGVVVRGAEPAAVAALVRALRAGPQR